MSLIMETRIFCACPHASKTTSLGNKRNQVWINILGWDLNSNLSLTIHLWKPILPDIGMMVRVFANGPGDQGSIPGRVIPKTQKMVLDAALLNTQHYKVRIKGKVEQSRERSSALPQQLGVVAIEKGTFGSPSTKVANFTNFTYSYINICLP